MSTVVIGIDPHKASHTAVAVDEHEHPLGQLRVRASAVQAEQLLDWARQWPQHSWAIENASGLGYLLAQQLAGAGEHVVDVQPKLAARVRLLATAASTKNDPNDARSVAIVALRSPGLPLVSTDDHAAVMKVWVRRRRHLSRTRTKLANQLHAVLGELVPGGFPRTISAPQAAVVLESVQPTTAAQLARTELAHDILQDLRHVDSQLHEVGKRLAEVVAASRTSLTAVFGVGPVVAATVIAITGDVHRFPTADRFAAYAGTAPIEVSSGPHKVFRLSRRGNRQLNSAIHTAAVSQIRYRHSEGRAYYDRKIAEGKSPRMALRALKRRITTTVYNALIADAGHRDQHTGQGAPDRRRTAPPAAEVKAGRRPPAGPRP